MIILINKSIKRSLQPSQPGITGPQRWQPLSETRITKRIRARAGLWWLTCDVLRWSCKIIPNCINNSLLITLKHLINYLLRKRELLAWPFRPIQLLIVRYLLLGTRQCRRGWISHGVRKCLHIICLKCQCQILTLNGKYACSNECKLNINGNEGGKTKYKHGKILTSADNFFSIKLLK